MGLTTKVGKYTIPVKGNFATLLKFDGGAGGKKQAGDYAFWTAELIDPRYGWNAMKGRRTKVFGRAYIALDAGDRFNRMRTEAKELSLPAEERKIYNYIWREMFDEGKNIKRIRASTLKEVRFWLESHEEDAIHAAGFAFIKGKPEKLELEFIDLDDWEK